MSTVDMLLGLTRPDAGTVTVFGVSPHKAVAAGMIGAMLQGGALPDDATVGETVAMVASLHRSPMPVAEALRRSGVEELATGGATSCPAGRSSACGSPLVLDEPTVAMTCGAAASSGSPCMASRTRAAQVALALLPGVTEVEVRANQATISTRDSDATLRAQLATYPQAHDIEVTAMGLEGAFLSLTSDDTARADRGHVRR